MVEDAAVHLLTMDFAARLAAARKQRGVTQATLAERAGIHVTQVRRYEAGTSAPTLDVLRNISVALHVSTDELVFADDERAPADELRLAFEATNDLDPDERQMIKSLIEAVLLKHEARRWAS
jgi:transcriptional regulator with XRE-family HTH domain